MFWETMFRWPKEKEEQIIFCVDLPRKTFEQMGWNIKGEDVCVQMDSKRILIEKWSSRGEMK